MINDSSNDAAAGLFAFYTVFILLVSGAASFTVTYIAESTAHEQTEKPIETEKPKPASPFTDSLGLSNTVEDAVFLCRRKAIKHIKTNPKATLPFVRKMFTQCMIKRKATI